MRVLVTGGAGFIGRHLVSALRSRSAEVTILDNLHRGQQIAGDGVAFKLADIRDRATVAAAMKGVDVVYHLAAQSNVLGAASDPDYSFSTNVVGTYNVLRSAQEQGVRRVVFTSSREVYGDAESLPVAETAGLNPQNLYGASKAASEFYCRQFASGGVEVMVPRLANVYGPGDRDRVLPLFIDRAPSGQALTIYGEGKVLDFVWIGDVVSALISASAAPADHPINIGTGQGTTPPELAERILRITGAASTIRQLPARSIEVNRFVADIPAARRILAYYPARPLEHLEAVVRHARSGQAPSGRGRGVAG
jgi:UDP-glucose 4-epimerase